MSTDAEFAGSPAGGQLWYCSKCTRMIKPPGAEGVVTPEGRFCAACAPAASVQAEAAPEAPVRASAYGIKPAKTEAIESIRRSTARPAERPSGTESSRRAAAPAAVPPAVRRVPTQLLIASSIFAFGLVLFLGVLLTRRSEGPEVAVEQAGGDVTAAQPTLAEAPAAPRTAAPAAADAAAGATPAGPRFLDVVETRRTTPSQPTAAAVPAAPSKAEAQGATPPKTAEARGTPKPPEPPKSVVPEGEQIKEFSAGLKKATELAAACKYAAALGLLRNLKEKYAAATWWGANGEQWSKTERAVQQQLADYNNEAEGDLQDLAKATDLQAVERIEARWRARAGGGASAAGQWALPEIVSMQAASGAVLARQPDGSMLVSGNNPPTDRYTIVARTSWARITAFRLEAIPDPSLPHGGPGRGPSNGNFALSTLTVDCAPLGNPGQTQRMTLSKASETYGQREHLADQALDNREDTWWDVFPETGKLHVAVFEAATPARFGHGATLTFMLAFQTGNPQHGLGRCRLLLTSAQPPPDAKTPTGEVMPPGQLGDELGAKPLQQILSAGGKTRIRIVEQQRERKLADLGQRLDTLGKQARSGSRGLEQASKSLEEVEKELAKDPVVAEKLVERVAGLRFDITLAREGELVSYRTAVRQLGAGAEISYDFSTPEQLEPWTWDDQTRAGDMDHDAKSKLVQVRTRGKHDWDGRDRRNTPVLRLPFHFRGDNWSFEATASLVSDGNKGAKPDYGILVWDGGSAVVRCSVKDATVKDIGLHIAASTPSKDNYWSKVSLVAGRPKERVRLRMVCEQGMISCTATSPAGKTASAVLKERIGFEPRYAGLFVRTCDDNEDACAAFEQVRLLGIPNKEKLKELADSGRGAAVAAARNALKGGKTGANIAPSGKAASLSGWRADAGGHEPSAAIDGKPHTFWDEEDNKPEYRFAVNFDQVRTVNAISILGYQHQNFAPKDFDIVADGKVIKEVRNAAYTDNLLRAEFPATQLRNLELKIMGRYGGSPAIRELGIYEP